MKFPLLDSFIIWSIQLLKSSYFFRPQQQREVYITPHASHQGNHDNHQQAIDTAPMGKQYNFNKSSL